MNWAPDWVTSSSNACEFVVGQIIACTEAGTTLMLLTQVRGYRCVFKSDKKKDFDLMIPSGENLGLFSNHISFCLTKEVARSRASMSLIHFLFLTSFSPTTRDRVTDWNVKAAPNQ